MALNVTGTPIPAQPAFYSALQPPAGIDYTSKDWLGLATSMLNYANVIFPQWDTTSEGDFGVMLVELFAYMGDILSFYGDRLAQEAYLPTATQRQSILNIAQLLGYTASNGSAATGTATLQNTSNVNITVPVGTQIATGYQATVDAPIVFQTTGAVTVPANGTISVNLQQGITYTQTTLGLSNGTAAQSFQIPQTGVLDGSVSVFVSSSSGPVEWSQVSYLIDYGPQDQVYTVSTDANQITSINFGDSVNGLIPGSGLTISATYTIIVGSAGNQSAGLVGVFPATIPNIIVPFQSTGSTLYQSSAMTGGSDPETNDQIRANAPQSYATQQRAVSLSDYEALALNVPGVVMTSAQANHSTSVTLYALGPNYQPVSSGLQANIFNYFQNKILAGTSVTIGNPAVILVDIGTSGSNMTLQVLPNYNQGVVLSNVTTALTAVLSPPNTTFGMLLNISDIYAAVMSVPGVAYCVIPIFTREDATQANTNPIQFRNSEIPNPGSFFITTSGGIVT